MRSNDILVVGQEAEDQLALSGLAVQTVGSGSYILTGPFWIQTANATINNAYDQVASWADTTHIKWRYVMLPPGASVTVELTGRSYIATINPVISTQPSQSPAASPIANPTTPAWVRGTKYSVINYSIHLASDSTGDICTSEQIPESNPPSLFWWDPTASSAFGSFTRFLPGSIVAVPEDCYFDIASHRLNSGTEGWSLYESNLTAAMGQTNVMMATALTPYGTTGFNGNVTMGTVLPPGVGSASTNSVVECWAFLIFTEGLGIPTSYCTAVAYVGAPETIIAGLFIGPIIAGPCMYPLNYAQNGNIAQCVSIYNPNLYLSTTQYLFGDQISAGFIFVEPGATANYLCVNGGGSVYPYSQLYNLNTINFRRKSQLLIGNAQRTS